LASPVAIAKSVAVMGDLAQRQESIFPCSAEYKASLSADNMRLKTRPLSKRICIVRYPPFLIKIKPPFYFYIEILYRNITI